jgi:hypothetical protein
MMENEADREPEEEKPRRKALSMEDLRRKYVLMVAKWRERQGASSPHRYGGRGRRESSPAKHQDHQAVMM